MKLLLVDGSNLVMRAAFGGDIPPAQAVPIASGLISRAGLQIEATHMVIALDANAPSWRKLAFPEYKAHRTVDTSPWLQAAREYWSRLGWRVVDLPGFEADDIIATIGRRSVCGCSIAILSNDSDLLPMTDIGIHVWKPTNGGQFSEVTAWDVCEKYALRSPAQLPHMKALTGEKGDNIPGVPGIGPVRAAQLLRDYGNLEKIIDAGAEQKCRHSTTVFKSSDVARRALRLVSLSCDAPVAPITPNSCTFSRH
jgi:DNA polymerase I